MTVQQTIEAKLRDRFAPVHLEVINESHMHNVPPGSESHFKVIVVSSGFEGLNRVRRQQEINGLLAEELKGPIHALSMETHTEGEWHARAGKVMSSPQCMGGSKADRSSDGQ